MIWQRCHVSQFESAALARLIEFRRPFPTPNSSKKKFLVNINYENYHWLVSRYSRECGWINGHNRKRLGGVGGGGDGWDGWMDEWKDGRIKGGGGGGSIRSELGSDERGHAPRVCHPGWSGRRPACIQRAFIQRNSGSIINKPPIRQNPYLSRINRGSMHAPLICPAFK